MAGRRALRAIERAQRAWAEELGEAAGLERLLDAEEALERVIAQLER